MEIKELAAIPQQEGISPESLWLQVKLKFAAFSHAVAIPFRTFKLLKELFAEGSHEVRTEFVYKSETYAFRTLIQPDADIINFLPDMLLMQSDLRYKTTYLEYYRYHLKKVENTFGLLQENSGFWVKAFDISLIGFNIAFLVQEVSSVINFNDINTFCYGFESPMLSFLYRLHFRELTVSYIIKGLFKIFKPLLAKKQKK